VAQRLSGLGYSVLSIDLRFPHASSAGVRQIELDITEEAPLLETGRFRPVDSVHVIVNAAAVRPTGSILHVDPREWQRCFEVNVTGTYLVSRLFLPKLRPNSTMSTSARPLPTGGVNWRLCRIEGGRAVTD